MKPFKSHIIVLAIVALGVILGGMAVRKGADDFIHAATGTHTSSVTNVAPAFVGGPTEKWDDTTYHDFWDSQSSGLATQLTEVYFVDSNIGWLRGGTGGIRKTTDGGQTWSDQTSGIGPINTFYFHDINTGWAVSNSDGIAYTTDGGANWNTQTSGTSGITLQGVHFIDDQIGWIVGNTDANPPFNGDAVILKTVNGGANWVAQTSGITKDLYDVTCIDSTTCWAVGATGAIVHTSNGTDWSTQTPSPTQYYYEVYFVDANNGWAVGANGGLTHTTNGGANWSAQTSGLGSTIMNDVHFVNSTTGWIVAHSGNILYTTNSGTNWDTVPSGAGSNALRGLHCVDENNCWIVGDNGTLLKGGWETESSTTLPTNDGTDVYFKATATDSNLDNYYLAVCKTDAATAGAPPACTGGAWGVSASTATGAEATASYTTGSGDETGCIGAGDDNCPWWAFVCDSSDCAASSQGSGDSGSAFFINHAPTFGTVTVTDTSDGTIEPGDSLRFTLPAAQIADVDTQGGQDIVKMTICTDATTSFTYGAGTCVGGSVVCTGTSANPSSVDATCDAGTNLVPIGTSAGAYNFKVYVYDGHDFAGTGTNQQSYTVQNVAPTFLIQPSDGAPWAEQTSDTVQQLRDVYFINTQTGWAVGMFGDIRYTSDGGESWSQQGSGLTVEGLTDIHCFDASNCMAVGGAGEIVKTINGGTTWTQPCSTNCPTLQQDGVYMVSATTVYIVGMSGEIRKSTNGGVGWTVQTPVGNNLRDVYCVDSNTCWTGGQNGNIYYTSNGTDWGSQDDGGSISYVLGIHCIDSNTCWATGAGGAIIKTTDGGATAWVDQTTPVTDSLYGLHFLDANNGWATGQSAVALHTDDGGTTWNRYRTWVSGTLWGVYATDTDNAWAVGDSGLIIKGHGGSWESSPTDVGSAVTFRANGSDDNGDNYYMAVCKTDAVSVGAPPTCPGGEWKISTVSKSNLSQEQLSYTTQVSDSTTEDWYAFVCDANACSSSVQASGNSGSPFHVNHKPAFVSDEFSVTDTDNENTITEILTDSDMENASVIGWAVAGGTGTTTKSTASPHTGDQAIRLTNTGGGTYSVKRTGFYTTGKTYRLRGWMRGDGSSTSPRIGQLPQAINGTTSSSWQAFDYTYVAATTESPYLQASNTGWAEFDDVSVVEVNALVDADMETAGFTNWLDGGSATLSKQTTDPHGGSQVLRVLDNGINSNNYAYQEIDSGGEVYRATGWARGDGTNYPAFRQSEVTLWQGTSSTDWQYFDVTFTSLNSRMRFYALEGTDSTYVEFDDVIIREAGSTEPGEQERFHFLTADSNWDDSTAVVCDTSGFNDGTRACNSEELCRTGMEWSLNSFGGALETVYFIDENTGWAAVNGQAGTFYKTIDGGDNFSTQTTGNSEIIYDIHFIDENTGYAVGTEWNSDYDGVILKTTNGGDNWINQLTDSTTTNRYTALHCIDASTCYAVGGGTVRKTTNGGTSWVVQDTLSFGDYFGMYFVDEQTGWVAKSQHPYIQKTIDGGSNWVTKYDENTMSSIYALDADTVWASGNNGRIIKSTDGGASWTEMPSGTSNELHSIAFIDANTGWAVGNSGEIRFTHDGGEIWTQQTSNTSNTLSDINVVNKNTAFITGYNSTFLKGTDGANHVSAWTAQDSGLTTEALLDIFFVNEKVGWASGDGSPAVMLKTTDGGATWVQQTSGTISDQRALWFVDENEGWTIGSNGIIRHTDDGGETWSAQSGGGGVLYEVQCIDSETCWTVGSSGIIRKTINGGSTAWTNPVVSGSTTSALNGLHFADKDTGWVVGAGDTIKKTTDGGANWSDQTSALSSVTYQDVACADANTCWAGTSNGKIINTTDGGTNWTEQTSPVEPYMVQKIHVIDKNNAWITATNGRYAYTTDGGTNWKGGTQWNKYIYGVYFIDKSTGWIAGQDGTLWRGSGTRYCDETDTDAGDSDSNPVYIGIPEPHGVKEYSVHIFDEHDFVDVSTRETQWVYTEDVAPTVPSWYPGGQPSDPVPAAGDTGGTAFVWDVRIRDDNGAGDLATISGLFFDDDAVDNDCSEDDNDCNPVASCSDLGDASSGNCSGYSATCADYQCTATVYYNSNASTNWTTSVTATDGTSPANDYKEDDTVNFTIAALSGVELVETGIAYGSGTAGSTSGGVSTSIGNVGNQVIDTTIQGTDMCIDPGTYTDCVGSPASDTIVREKQEWTQSGGVGFTWGTENVLVETANDGCTPGGGGDCDDYSYGCADLDLAVRADSQLTTENESLYWKLQLPSVQKSGGYTGVNTFSSIVDTTCTGTP